MLLAPSSLLLSLLLSSILFLVSKLAMSSEASSQISEFSLRNQDLFLAV